MNQILITNRNFVLRQVLNSDENTDIIKDMIEAFLPIKIIKIAVNTYLDKKYLPEKEKFGVVDVRIKTEKNKEYNIGIQFLDGKYIQTKIALYYLYIHTNQIYYKDTRKIAKTITINILDFPYYKSFGYHKKIILNKFKEIDFSEEKAEAHIIELERFNILDLKNMTKEEQWITYLKGSNKEGIRVAKKDNKYINKLDEMVCKYWEEEKI